MSDTKVVHRGPQTFTPKRSADGTNNDASILRAATVRATVKTQVTIVIHTGGMPVEVPIDEIVVKGNGDIQIHAYTV